jgi:hypothetical protein
MIDGATDGTGIADDKASDHLLVQHATDSRSKKAYVDTEVATKASLGLVIALG